MSKKKDEIKVVLNAPEEKRRQEQAKLDEECNALLQETMEATEEFIEELDRYRVIPCPVCYEMTKVDTFALEEELVSEKEGFFRSVRTYAKTVKCPNCESVLSFDETKDTVWVSEFLEAAKTFGAIILLLAITVPLGIYAIKSADEEELGTAIDDVCTALGGYSVELAPQDEQEKVFSVTVTNIEQNAQGFQYELTDKEGMTIVVFSEIDQCYEVGKAIDVHAQYNVDGTKVFTENNNINSWKYTMNSKIKE